MIVPVVAPRSSGARRWRYGFFALLSLACIGAALLYAINPSGTASTDPRARVLGYATYRIPSSSMSPTLQVGDVVLVSSWAYARRPPRQGELIVFFPPHRPGVAYVSRVAAAAGDRVAISDGVLFVNSMPVREPYLDPATLAQPESRTLESITVPPGALFVLGDNRDHSEDSRYWGFASIDAVAGRVSSIVFGADLARVGSVR